MTFLLNSLLFFIMEFGGREYQKVQMIFSIGQFSNSKLSKATGLNSSYKVSSRFFVNIEFLCKSVFLCFGVFDQSFLGPLDEKYRRATSPVDSSELVFP